MTANHTILYTRPGLAEVIDRVRATLPAEVVAQIDDRMTLAEQLVEEVFKGVAVWRLKGTDGLWVRSPDLADVMEVDSSNVRHRMTNGLESGELTESDIRWNVRDNAVDSSCVTDSQLENGPSNLTNSPTGVTMLSLRACQILVTKCEGQRGVAFRAGLLRVMEASAEMERAVLVLLAERLVREPVSKEPEPEIELTAAQVLDIAKIQLAVAEARVNAAEAICVRDAAVRYVHRAEQMAEAMTAEVVMGKSLNRLIAEKRVLPGPNSRHGIIFLNEDQRLRLVGKV